MDHNLRKKKLFQILLLKVAIVNPSPLVVEFETFFSQILVHTNEKYRKSRLFEALEAWFLSRNIIFGRRSLNTLLYKTSNTVHHPQTLNLSGYFSLGETFGTKIVGFCAGFMISNTFCTLILPIMDSIMLHYFLNKVIMNGL